MDATKDVLQIKWSSLKAKVRKHWWKITEADMNHLSGKTDELINILRKRYGYGRAQAEIEINNWLIEQDGDVAESN